MSKYIMNLMFSVLAVLSLSLMVNSAHAGSYVQGFSDPAVEAPFDAGWGISGDFFGPSWDHTDSPDGEDRFKTNKKPWATAADLNEALKMCWSKCGTKKHPHVTDEQNPISTVPVPAGVILLGSALAGLGLYRRNPGGGTGC